jgi:hypothetical protein
MSHIWPPAFLDEFDALAELTHSQGLDQSEAKPMHTKENGVGRTENCFL